MATEIVNITASFALDASTVPHANPVNIQDSLEHFLSAPELHPPYRALAYSDQLHRWSTHPVLEGLNILGDSCSSKGEGHMFTYSSRSPRIDTWNFVTVKFQRPRYILDNKPYRITDQMQNRVSSSFTTERRKTHISTWKPTRGNNHKDRREQRHLPSNERHQDLP